MGAISEQTAMDIAMAYREVKTATALLADIRDARQRRGAPDIRDAFGRLQDGLQLGVPSGDTSHRLFNVPWSLAEPIIEAHIRRHQTSIALLTDKARAEMEASATGEA